MARAQVLAAGIAAATFALALAEGTIPPQATALASVLAWSAALSVLLWDPGRLRTVPPAGWIAGAALAGLAVMCVISMGWAPDDGRAFEEGVRVSLYVAIFVASVLAVGRGEARAALTGLAAGLLAVALLALGSRLLPDLLTGDASRREQYEAVRLGYPVAYWNGLAACLAMAVSLWAWLGATAATPGRRAGATAALVPLVLTLYLTGSRGGFVATAVGLSVLVALSPVRRRLLVGTAVGLGTGLLLAAAASFSDSIIAGSGGAAQSRAGALLAVLAAGGAVLAAVLRLGLDRRVALPRPPRRLAVAALAVGAAAAVALAVADRRDAGGGPAADPTTEQLSPSGIVRPGTTGRLDLWSVALDGFASAPVLGLGAAGFQTWWNQHATEATVNRHAHSLYIGRLAELGLAGFLLLMAFVGAVVREATRRTFGDLDGTIAATTAVAAAALATGLVEWTFAIPAAFAPLVLAAALLTGPATSVRPPAGASRRSLRGVRVALVAIWALGVATILGGGALYLSERALGDSRDAAAREDWAAAASHASRAQSLQPFSVTPLIQLAQVQQGAFDLEGAKQTLDEAVEMAPEDPRVAILRARLMWFLEDEGWREELERFQQLTP